ncbi:MAG: GAF domain-containing protein [Ktedonobacteraceae bacterium]|nr:GAF domain-containing protein [Ktedonobacteraceae bacterium]
MASWSTILQRIIKAPHERQRLCTALGIAPMTLQRWASGESRPQRSHLKHLVQVVHPADRQELIDALKELYPPSEVESWIAEAPPEQISSEFFAQVLNIVATTTDSARFWRVSDVVLKQALLQLDPNQTGMQVRLIQCMPPSQPDGIVRSLRERAGKGNSPWTSDLEHESVFLGMESLSGYAVETRHRVWNDNLREKTTSPAIRDEFEVSAAADPIRLGGKIAGCLLASSVQVQYFSQQRLTLLSAFSDLLALAFDKRDFYEPEKIMLGVMPPPMVQRKYIAGFRERVTEKFRQFSNDPTLRNADIELMVWQELEREFLEGRIDVNIANGAEGTEEAE